MRLIDSAEYKAVEGSRSERKLRVYALSTCAFCEKSMRYLESHGFSYEYIFLDRVPVEQKKTMKTELKEQFGNIPVFPLLVIDGKEALSGFNEERWAEVLGISQEKQNHEAQSQHPGFREECGRTAVLGPESG